MNVLKDVIIPSIKKEVQKTLENTCEYVVYGASKNEICDAVGGRSSYKTTVVGPVVIYKR